MPAFKAFLPRLSYVAILALVLACSEHVSNVEQGDIDGVFHIGIGASPQTIDPHVATGISERYVINALFEGLVTKDPKSLKPIPAMAERWSISEDGKQYTFYLRKNARWSDGNPLTANDFVWSWQRVLNPVFAAQYAYSLYFIKNAEAYHKGKLTDFSQVGIQALDEHTLRIRLNSATPYFLQLLDHYAFYPVPRHIVSAYGGDTMQFTRWTHAQNIVSNGPFMLQSWQLNKGMSAVQNPHYWGREALQLNGIRFHFIDNTRTEEHMFRVGQLHYTSEIPLRKSAEYIEAKDPRARIAPYLGTYFYRVNTNRPWLADKRVRRALALAIDRKALVKAAHYGLTVPAYSITPPGIGDYKPPITFGFNPDEARRLLAEAGYPNGDGIPKLRLVYNTLDSHRQLAVILQQMWQRELGIDITLENQDWKVFLNTVNSGDYDLARAGWLGDYNDPQTFLEMWLTDGGNNRTGWSNPEFDALIGHRAPNASSPQQRLRLLAEAERLLLQDMPVLPLYIYIQRHLIAPSAKGLPYNIMGEINYRTIYLAPDADAVSTAP